MLLRLLIIITIVIITRTGGYTVPIAVAYCQFKLIDAIHILHIGDVGSFSDLLSRDASRGVVSTLH